MDSSTGASTTPGESNDAPVRYDPHRSDPPRGVWMLRGTEKTLGLSGWTHIAALGRTEMTVCPHCGAAVPALRIHEHERWHHLCDYPVSRRLWAMGARWWDE